MFECTQAFLFDFDGTLVQQRIDFAAMRSAVADLVSSFGVDMEPLAGLYVLELIERAAGILKERDGEQSEDLVHQAQRAITDIELQAAEGARVFAGVPEMLAQLRLWGYPVGIVTRNCRLAVGRVLQLNLLQYDVLLTRDDVGRVKPDPEHLQVALQVLGVPGTRAAMCGDHPMDVVAGKRIGARTVGVLSADSPPDYFASVQPDLVVSQVTDLLQFLPR